MKTGIELIAIERKRQIEEEGYTTKYDDNYKGDDLARAGACYATPEEYRTGNSAFDSPLVWPWVNEVWKPTPDDRIKELVKAGALIAAEIDRLNRLKG